MFDDVVGHAPQCRALAGAVQRWRAGGAGLHHAYLLSGVEEYPASRKRHPGSVVRSLGHGQWRLALELGAVIVAGGEADSETYRRALAGRHLDLTVIEREGEVIRIEQVERLVGELSLRPFLAGHRVWVIDEADALNAAAANKLLKSLEEPPAHVHFLLATAEPERVLPTIASRCQLVELGPAAREPVALHLAAAFGLPQEVAGARAALAGGSVERAERLAADERSGRRAELTAAALSALAGNHVAREHYLSLVLEQVGAEQAAVDEALAAELKRIEVDVPDERDKKWHTRRAKDRAKREAARAARREVMRAVEQLSCLLRDLWVVSTCSSAVLLNHDRAAEIARAVTMAPACYERQLAAAGATVKNLRLNVDPVLALRGLFGRLEEVARSCAR
jgi:DNA polymerase-3 subunit delta'